MRSEARIRIKWQLLYEYMQEAKRSKFFRDLLTQIGGTRGLMGSDDCFMLYAVVRYFRPSICLETGTGQGKSSTFILEALEKNNVENGLSNSSPLLITIDRNVKKTGELIPKHLWKWCHQIHTSVEDYVGSDEFKKLKLDLFLHDSTHRYKHQMWEFETFWSKLGKGGVLCSHDVDYNTSFLDFVVSKYKMDDKGLTDFEKSEFAVWLKVSNFGFVVRR